MAALLGDATDGVGRLPTNEALGVGARSAARPLVCVGLNENDGMKIEGVSQSAG